MSKLVRTFGVVVVVVAIFGMGWVAGSLHPLPALAQTGQPANTDQLFQPFWESWDIVHQRYVDPIDDDALMQGAIRGMVAALGDVHSAYMSPNEFAQMNSDLSGQFEGIGATVRKDTITGGLRIVETIAGSPARAAGIKANDLIMTVDGQDITPLTEEQIIGKVRGKAGTNVKLGILRPGVSKLLTITVMRALIQVPNVTTALYVGNIGYVKLAEFTDKSSQEMSRALSKLKANQLNGLILDLRGNPGGGVQPAIDIASDFIKSGTIVTFKGRPGTPDQVLRSTGRTLAGDVPLVVLIDAGSASASELVAGALHDRGRAITVGTTSFGKGSEQSVMQISNHGGLRITIAHFFTPTGRAIHNIGLTPDYYVAWDSEANPNFDPQLREALYILRGEL
ncbi:MAG TPA: S41 family peptidase [Aggregatilineales bacterium]|nr:S41 family peptidase [Aggregatilineales bacterium]